MVRMVLSLYHSWKTERMAAEIILAGVDSLRAKLVERIARQVFKSQAYKW